MPDTTDSYSTCSVSAIPDLFLLKMRFTLRFTFIWVRAAEHEQLASQLHVSFSLAQRLARRTQKLSEDILACFLGPETRTHVQHYPYSRKTCVVGIDFVARQCIIFARNWTHTRDEFNNKNVFVV